MSEETGIADTFGQRFNDDPSSDLTIKCRDKSWKVHRVMVSSQSTLLHQKGYADVIDLDDDDPDAVDAMMKYFYSDEYHHRILDDNKRTICSEAQIHASIYSVAQKYQVKTLQDLAAKSFSRMLRTQAHDMEEFLTLASHAYTVTTGTNVLRTIVANHAKSYFEEERPPKKDLRDTLKKVPDFAIDLLLLVLKDL